MQRRAVLAIVLAVVVSLSGCASAIDSLPVEEAGAGPATGEEWTVEVVEVVDGDTLTVRFPDGTTEDVRLLGVDTPEVHVEVDPAEYEGIPENDDARAWLRDWGHKASEYMRQRVADAEVRIATDAQADRRGGYGRLLVYVFDDGENVNADLLEQGYARMYDSEFSKHSSFEHLEATARSQNAGLWAYTDGAGADAATDTGDGGAIGDTGLAVATVHADADGHDGENLNDEYVVLENRGNRTLDLGGWTIRDDAGKTFVIPDGVELAPGAQITVYTGSGENTEDALYWGAERPVWNNDGDVVHVENENGTVVVEYEY
jgi:micrococcal nuclease